LRVQIAEALENYRNKPNALAHTRAGRKPPLKQLTLKPKMNSDTTQNQPIVRHRESLAQTLRGWLGDNPLILLEGEDGEAIRHFMSDPFLDCAARELAKRVAPACPQCGKAMIFVTATDFEGWSCMGTVGCVVRLPLPNDQALRLAGHKTNQINQTYESN
jgi:hypothetical protein